MHSLGKKLIFSFFHAPILSVILKKLFSQGIMSDFVRVFFKLFSMVILRILWEQNLKKTNFGHNQWVNKNLLITSNPKNVNTNRKILLS